MSKYIVDAKKPLRQDVNSADVLIIGAGISGLCTAIDMIKSGSGRNFLIIEKGNQVGGTWNDNVYPGCCCDVLSHLYSFSFEPNPDWTREYPGQQEILAYLIGVEHKYQLYRHIRFASSVEESRWDDQTHKWRTTVRRMGGKEVETGSQYTIISDFLVSAVGQLNIPRYPSIPGIDKFRGRIMHSARWDWDFDLRGKRVGIIGTGATAAQIVPELAQECEKLVVFQRTPAWVMPRHDGVINASRRTLYRYASLFRKRYRAQLMDFREGVAEALFDVSSAKHEMITRVSRQHLLDQLPGETNAQLRDVLTPDYSFSCKRIVVSDDFYPALKLPQVCLETNSIQQISPEGVTMTGSEHTHHDLDVLVLATGFRSTQFMHPIRVYGSGGHSLSEAWSRNGASAYLGITVDGIPNFGMTYGPGTNLAHNSLILQIEAQSLYINTLISSVLTAKRRNETLRLEPKPCVVRSYNRDLQDRLSRSTFADPSCTSWFKDEHGRITTNWCGSAIEYAERVNFVNWSDFIVEGSGKYLIDAIPGGVTRWKRRVEETQISDRVLVGMFGSLVAGLISALWVWRWIFLAIPVRV